MLTKAIEQMQQDADPELGGALLLSVTIRLLIDPENMLTNSTASGTPALRTEKTEFLNYFYLHCMPQLISPLRAISKDPSSLKGKKKASNECLSKNGIFLDCFDLCDDASGPIT